MSQLNLPHGTNNKKGKNRGGEQSPHLLHTGYASGCDGEEEEIEWKLTI